MPARPRPAAGGGTWVDVAPERLPRWLEGFAARHGRVVRTGLRHEADDGATAEVVPPLRPVSEDLVPDLVVGVLLVRLGGFAAGLLAPDGRWLTTRVGSRPVHGRSAAGGQSQQRFARRRENQVAVVHARAADLAAAVLLPVRCGALVTGGERTAVDAVLADRRLAALLPLRVERFLDVPDPRQRVLLDSAAAVRALTVRVRGPAAPPPPARVPPAPVPPDPEPPA